MQRRGINKRLSFAEAENGQKDRNKEEVEEEREPAAEKGINKSGGPLRAERKRRVRKRKTEESSSKHRQVGPVLKSLVALLDQRPDLLLSRYTIVLSCIESFYFRRVRKRVRRS